MPDIRNTGTIKDTFNRPDENPIAFPWTRNWSGANITSCELRGSHIGSPSINPSTSAQSFYSVESYTNDEIEIWAKARGNAPLQESYRIGLCDDASGMNGYVLRCTNPVGDDHWEIRKYTGGTFTTVALEDFGLPSDGHLVLIQLDATHVRAYLSTNNGNDWTNIVSVADTTYRSNLFLHLGANGAAPSWDDVGGGIEDFVPQIYRRPNE